MYDVIVAGLGGMGSATLAQCALRGASVLGIEQYERGHERGASTGKTRIIRQAYYEDPAYVPMVLRAYDLWRELEARTGEEILRITGLLMAGGENSGVIAGSLRAARAYGLPVEPLNAGQMRERWPAIRVDERESGVFEAAGGIVFPEAAVRAHLAMAHSLGAQMRFETSIESWENRGDAVTVVLRGGETLTCRMFVVSTGPWIASEFAKLGIPLRIQRNVQVWFEPESPAYDAAHFPVFLIERETLPAPLYGFPDLGEGVKAAFHGFGAETNANALDRAISYPRDVAPLAAALEGWMPGAAGHFAGGKACMYSLTPDEHFVIDKHPHAPNVILCGGFSGHGFKFASVIGEICAQLALDGSSALDIGFLSALRFSGN